MTAVHLSPKTRASGFPKFTIGSMASTMPSFSRIVEANDGVDGLKKLAAERFDIIFTDINMPVMDGLKLISLVREDANQKGVPIVVITTEGAQEDRQQRQKDRAETMRSIHRFVFSFKC